MPSINWNKLDSPNPIVAWSILTQEISDKFFNETLIAVPSIDDASYYDLMVCFSKISHFWQRTPTFRLHGHFLDISAPAKDEMELMDLFRFNFPAFELSRIFPNFFSCTNNHLLY